jgi:hypothetical protein
MGIFMFARSSEVSEVNAYYYGKIRGSHGGDYEEWRLLGCYDVWLL